MATLQVKGIDDGLYKALSARAARDNRSISQEVVMMIREFLARPGRSAGDATEEFLALCGEWDDRRSSKEIAADIRKQRKPGRRFGGTGSVFD